MIRATVVVCTYSFVRWPGLLSAVDSVLRQTGDEDEVLVVIDHNAELFARATAEFAGLPGIRVIANAADSGISGARNTAIAASRGEVVAFLDDDAVASEGWLLRMLDALRQPQVLAVGTAAVPAWPGGRRPPWFPPEFDWVVGCTYDGLPTEAAPVRNVIGAAMAFRREAFAYVGGFSSTVGRIGRAPTGCEETEFCIRLRQARPGATIMHLPDVSVTHQVPADRTNLRYFFRRCAGEGRSKARVARLVGVSDGLASERAYLTSVLPRGIAREIGRGLRGAWAGWCAAALIVGGTALTACAYLVGRLLPTTARETEPARAAV